MAKRLSAPVGHFGLMVLALTLGAGKTLWGDETDGPRPAEAEAVEVEGLSAGESESGDASGEDSARGEDAELAPAAAGLESALLKEVPEGPWEGGAGEEGIEVPEEAGVGFVSLTPDAETLPATEDGALSEIPAALAIPMEDEIPESLILPESGAAILEETLFYDSETPIEFDLEPVGREPSFIFDSGLTLDVGFNTSITYDDNIFLSEEKEGDTVFRFQPDLSIAFGDGRAKQESYIEVSYRPTANAFFENDEESSLDEDLSGAAQWRKSKITVLGIGQYQKLSDATAEVGDRFNRKVYSTALEVAYAMTEKVGIRLAGGYEGYRYEDDAEFEDSDEYRGELAVTYVYSPKTNLAVGYVYGELDFKESGKQTYHQAFVDAEWLPREKIGLVARAGAEWRDLITKTQTIPILEAGVRYQPREKTFIILRGYSREETSPYVGGESFTATGIRGEVSQKLGKRFTAGLESGFENADYNGGLNESLNSREDDIWFARASLDYQLREWLALELFYLHRENATTSNGSDYTNNQIGLNGKVLF